MFYYKNKVKPIVILCLVIVALTVSFTVCLWDDTSLKSLTANAGTADFVGQVPVDISKLELGNRSMSISGVTYTVVNKYDKGGVKFITLLSDMLDSLTGSWQNSSQHDNTSSAYDNSGANGIKERITNYYNSSVNGAEIKVAGNKIGVINDETHKIVGHLGGGWELWPPSEHEMYGTTNFGYLSKDGNQPQMKWIIDKENIGQVDAPGSRVTGAYYWLRTPSSTSTHACVMMPDGRYAHSGVSVSTYSIRVALNLKI